MIQGESIRAAGPKHWFTAAELADMNLPGLSRAKRKVNEIAADERWGTRVDAAGQPLARKRNGRGGGLEYHWSLLPTAARTALARSQAVGDLPEPANDRTSAVWQRFEQATATAKAEAARRLHIMDRIELFERARMTRSVAVATVAADGAASAATLWNWLALIDGVPTADRLAHLAPKRIGGGRKADVDDGFWLMLKSDYLRPEKPTWASCYCRQVREYAEPRGLTVPHMKSLQRKLERELDPRYILAKRQGAEALRRTLPPQTRTVADLHALELVNIDGHTFDVFVQLPNGQVGRPVMVAIQDIYSRKMLAWRFGESESAVQTRLAFADLFRTSGIPKGCVLDNGRAFASKWITGGATSRFRFKIREDEPTGLLTALGVEIHWALPYRGQSKPIERGFRDLCDTIAKHPALAGAYTGNTPLAKPENYGSRAVPWAEFVAVANAELAVHNARTGRRTEMARGRSFDETFAESYAAAPIGRATPEQMRLALLTADEVSADRQTGAVTLFGNRYWSPELSALAGKRVTVRFDPDDLMADIHVYDRTGRFLSSAGVWEATGFLDVKAAKDRAKLEGGLRRKMRELDDAEQLLTAAQVAERLEHEPSDELLPEPTVVRPVRHRGQTAAAVRPRAIEPDDAPIIDRFSTAFGRLRAVE